ncbi:hypothetical protein I3760_12G035200 [Carya illinoinensis]|nr:hypothetical protein I3760_12G035200 [Carya illinoinensis]
MAASSLQLQRLFSILFPSKPPTTTARPPPSNLHLPKKPTSGWVPLVATRDPIISTPPSTYDYDVIPTLYPALAHSNTLFFKSSYNVQIIVGEKEPEDILLNRFRREVLKAGVIQECKRRMFFENKQDKKKRKARQAARRNRKRRPQPRDLTQAKQETPRKKKIEEEDDNWEDYEVNLPYC